MFSVYAVMYERFNGDPMNSEEYGAHTICSERAFTDLAKANAYAMEAAIQDWELIGNYVKWTYQGGFNGGIYKNCGNLILEDADGSWTKFWVEPILVEN